jgi:hypothetical protein
MTKRVKVYQVAEVLAEYLEKFRRRDFDGSFWALRRFGLVVTQFKNLLYDEIGKVKKAEDKAGDLRALKDERAEAQRQKAKQKNQATRNQPSVPR